MTVINFSARCENKNEKKTSWATSMSQPSLSSWRVTKKSAQLAKMLAVTNKAVLLELKHFCCLDTAITKEV